MFSTSMIASSTTSPNAMTKPANTIVLTVPPRQYNTIMAAISESGIAIALIIAHRQSYRNASSTNITRMQPRSIEWLRFASERSIKVAGRKMVVSNCTSPIAGFSSAMALSTPRVTASVFAHGCFSTINSNPGWLLIIALPIGGA